MHGLRKDLGKSQLPLRDHDIHIIAISETTLDPSYSTQLTRNNGFEHEHKDRTSNGEGVAINIKDSISSKLRKDIPCHDLELICVETLPSKAKSYFLVAWYRPRSYLLNPSTSLNYLYLSKT